MKKMLQLAHFKIFLEADVVVFKHEEHLDSFSTGCILRRGVCQPSNVKSNAQSELR
jgi:hypothetical protein